MAQIGSLVVSLIAETAEFVNGMNRAQSKVHEFKSLSKNMVAEGITGAANIGLDQFAEKGTRAAEAANLLRRNIANLTNPVGWVALTADIIGTGLALSQAEEAEKSAERAAEGNRQAMMAMGNAYDEASKKAMAYQAAVEQQSRINALGQAGGNMATDLAFQIDTFNMSGADKAVAEYWQRIHEYYATHQEDIKMMSEADKQAAEQAQIDEADRIRRLADRLDALNNATQMERRLADIQRQAIIEGRRKEALTPAAAERVAQPIGDSTRSPGALSFGSNQAFSAEVNRNSELVTVAKQQLEVQKKIATSSEELGKKAIAAAIFSII
jgi:hypothetical protein